MIASIVKMTAGASLIFNKDRHRLIRQATLCLNMLTDFKFWNYGKIETRIICRHM